MANVNKVDTNDLIETLKAKLTARSGHFLNAEEVSKLVHFIAACGVQIGGAISGNFITTRPSASVTADATFVGTASGKSGHNS